MGTGIGIVASRTAGAQVKFVDAKDEQLRKSEDFVKSWIQKEMDKQRMTEEDKKAMLSRVSYHNSISKLTDVDFAIEVFIILKIFSHH